MTESLYRVDQDYTASVSPNFAATSGRAGQAPATSQGGRVVLFVNPSGKLAQANVDANGNLTTVATGPTGAGLNVTAGSAAGASATQQGGVVFGVQTLPAPSLYQPVNMDGLAAVNVHLKSKPTYRFCLPAQATAQNKVMLSIYNGSAAQIIRVQEIALYIPPQSVAGSILGSSGTTYLPVYCNMQRITGHTAKTGASASIAIPAGSADSGDTLDAGVTVLSNATVSNLSSVIFHRADANNNGMGANWYVRSDPNSKTLVLRPGEGVAVICISTGMVASGGSTVQSSMDMEMVITQAAA